MFKVFIRGASRGYQVLVKICGSLSGICVLAMVLTIVVDIAGRTLFSRPLEGTLEFNEMLMVVIVFLGVAWTQSEKGNIKIEVLTSRLSPKRVRAVNLAVWSMSLVFCVLITLGGITEAMHSARIQEELWGIARFPVWPGKIILAFGCLLLSIQLCIDMIRELCHLLSREDKI